MLKTFNAFNKFRIFKYSCYFSSCAQPSNDLGFKTSYNREETNKILDIVNKSSLVELKNYQISNQRIQKILKRRDAKGNFETIEDLLEVDGFGIKILEKFCNSIISSKLVSGNNNPSDKLSDVLKTQTELSKRQQFITPILLETIRTKMTTLISFHVDLNYFAWTKFYYDRDSDDQNEEPKFFVEGWNCYEFTKPDKNLRITDMIELLVKFNEQIPHADLYVLESMPVAVQAKQPGSALQININIQNAQLFAMLCGLMASRRSVNKLLAVESSFDVKLGDGNLHIPYIDSVYLLKNFLPSRFYKILIGNERVSSANVINQIVAYNYSSNNATFDPTYAYVHVSEEYREFFENSSPIHQEYLGSSMLVGLTFLKLCIEKCSGSLEKLNSRIKKN